jgi:2-isopropylmalate synthase
VPANHRPFVGRSAFAHKGGIHVSAIMKTSRAYEHMDPETVGNQRRVLMSDLAGKSNVEYKAKEMGVDLGSNGNDSKTIVAEIKQLEDEGYQFDVADGSFKIMLEKFTEQFKPLFDLESFRVTIEKDKDLPLHRPRHHQNLGGRQSGDYRRRGLGPVSALDNALRKALGNFYPDLDTMQPGGLQGQGHRRPQGYGCQGTCLHRITGPGPDLEHHRRLRRYHRSQLAGPGRQFPVQTGQGEETGSDLNQG